MTVAGRLRRLWPPILAGLASFGLLTAAAPAPTAAAACQFGLGFKVLRDAIPTQVGDCLEDESHDPTSGDALQRTTAHHGDGGLLVWRKADNWTAFTDGAQTWINGPAGLAFRSNDQRYNWEADASGFPQPPATGSRCGTERWPVKTLSDPRAASVDLTPHSMGV